MDSDVPVLPGQVPVSDPRITVVTTDYALEGTPSAAPAVETEIGMGLTVQAPKTGCRTEKGSSPSVPDSPVTWRALKMPQNGSDSGRPSFDTTIHIRHWPAGNAPTRADIRAIETAELEDPAATVERGLFHGVPCLRARVATKTAAGEPMFISSYNIFGERHIAIGVVSDDGFDQPHHQQAETIAFSITPVEDATIDEPGS